MLTVHVEGLPSPHQENTGRAWDAGPLTVTLRCQGRIVLGVEAETLRCLATARTEGRVVLDLQDVCGMDAAGLGLLAELHCRARQRTAWLSIRRPSPCVQRLLGLTGLQAVLNVELAPSALEHVSRQRSAMTA
jgi:anti-anti-sigma factor